MQGANYSAGRDSVSAVGRGLHEYRNKTLAKDDPYPKCVPHGGPRQFAAANGFKILQLPEVQRIYIISGGAARSWREIYMDGRPHPDITSDEFNPGYMGHSVGRWEGDTLVVDTVGFNERDVASRPGGHADHRGVAPDRAILPPQLQHVALRADDRRSRRLHAALVRRLEPSVGEQDMEEYFCQDNERDSRNLVGEESARTTTQGETFPGPPFLLRQFGRANT